MESAKSSVCHDGALGNHWLAVRLYTLEDRRVDIDGGLVDGAGVVDARLGTKGTGGSCFWVSGGGVRLTNVRNEGTALSIPLREEAEEELSLTAGGRLSMPGGLGAIAAISL